MSKEICFFCNRPLMKRDTERFGFELLRKRGFKVFYLDISGICNREYAGFYQKEDLASCEGIIKPLSRKKVSDFLGRNRGLFGIDIMKPNNGNLFFFRTLKKLNIKYATFCTSALPVSDVPQVSSAKKARPVFSLKKIVKKLAYIRLKMSKKSIRMADYLIKGGLKDGTDYLNTGKNSEVIWAHALDYDLYLKLKKENPAPLISGEYGVFLDEYFPLHPDHLIRGAVPNPYFDPSEYYKELNVMLSRIEEEMKVPIVIAAHPRSKYETMQDPFHGRTMIKGKTMELVAGAKFALTHGSTSANMAVLFNKPVIFLLPDKAKGTYYDSFSRVFSEKLGKAVLDTAKILKAGLKNELAVNEKQYEQYKADHIKSPGSQEKYFWDIIADKIEEE